MSSVVRQSERRETLYDYEIKFNSMYLRNILKYSIFYSKKIVSILIQLTFEYKLKEVHKIKI